MIKNFSVKTKDAGKRLDVFLRENIEGLSAKKLKEALLFFTCKVNQKVERFASYKVKSGDLISFNQQLYHSESPKYDEKIILYEDEHYLVINKPPHLTCDIEKINQFLNKNLYLVHRLDKQTTGILVLAKNLQALSSMEDLFRKRKVEKNYFAIVVGSFSYPKIKVSKPIKKVQTFDGGGLWQCHPQGLKALTVFNLIEAQKKISLVKCQPVTGRTHQIRVHLAQLGFPLLGDYLYGKEQAIIYKRFMLHSACLQFVHPYTQQKLSIEASAPLDFCSILAKHNIKNASDGLSYR